MEENLITTHENRGYRLSKLYDRRRVISISSMLVFRVIVVVIVIVIAIIIITITLTLTLTLTLTIASPSIDMDISRDYPASCDITGIINEDDIAVNAMFISA